MTASPLENELPPLDGAALLARLPEVRGTLTPMAPLHNQSWFGVGGPAEVLFRPKDEEDLAAFLAACPSDVPLTLLGHASNTLIRDGGVEGVVIRLGPAFGKISIEGTTLEAGAAAADIAIARKAEEAELAGLAFLSGIPGSLGGALRMNAGAYGGEIKDTLTSVRALDRTGQIRVLTKDEMGFSYRHASAPENLIFLAATFALSPGDKASLAKERQRIAAKREASQPLRAKTCGSTFANPEGDPAGRKAWQLIEEAGCKGATHGGAEVSSIHCNFLINMGGATAHDLEALGEEIRARVENASGVTLRWEIKRIGRKAPHEQTKKEE